MNILILGSSGFIGSNLTKKLMGEGHYVVGVDIEIPKYIKPNRFIEHDLTKEINGFHLLRPEYDRIQYDEIYILACCMGGMGFIGDEENHGYDIAIGSTAIVLNSIKFCRKWNPGATVFYSSSACVYNQELQKISGAVGLKESDAVPSSPDLLYGWQKLYAEKMMLASGLNVRIARFHNIFGEYGTWNGGKEKAPAAIMRKAITSNVYVEVWGDGTAERSFLYIGECLKGVELLMKSDYRLPLNIGSDEGIKINDLAKMAIEISGKTISIMNIPGNVGVQSRNSDNTLCSQVLGWKPTQPLRKGMEKLYSWLLREIK